MTCCMRAHKAQAGVALVEFALLMPLLSLLLIGIVEFARFEYYSILVANAARAGVQYGAQNLITADDTTDMNSAATSDEGSLSTIKVTSSGHYCKCADGTTSTCLSGDCSSSHRLTYVFVDTSGTFTSLFSFPGIPSTFTVTSDAVLQVAD